MGISAMFPTSIRAVVSGSTLLLSALISVGATSGESLDRARVISHSEADAFSLIQGTNYHVTVSDSHFVSTPPWTPSVSTPPPLAIYKAVGLATDALAEIVDTAEDYYLTRCVLQRYANSDKWYYIIAFEHDSNFVSLPVLVTGEVLKPRIWRSEGRTVTHEN